MTIWVLLKIAAAASAQAESELRKGLVITMKSINETSLNRLFNTHTENGYAMVSACRNDWCPYKDETDKKKRKELEVRNRQMNNKKTEELKSDIYDFGFQYIPVKGGFIEKSSGVPKEEQSFIIVNFKRGSKVAESDVSELKALAIDLCEKYNQDSVLVVESGKNPTYYKKDGSVDFELGSNKSVRDNAQDFFTRLGGGRQFTFIESVEQPHTLNGYRSRASKGEICEY